MKTLTLDQERNRARWVADLRSGRYKQGRQFLKKRGRFCCLGVGAEGLGCTWVKGQQLASGQLLLDRRDGLWGALSDKYLNALGLTYETESVLQYANDNEKKNFNEIADMIESGEV